MLSARIGSPVGPLTIFGGDAGLRAILWDGDLGTRVGIDAPIEPGDHPTLDRVAAQLDEYFGGERLSFDVSLDLEGTDFQRRVWEALIRIPPGQTRTYAQVAAAIGRPDAVRAVGAANGRNPLSIVVPCHRVVGSNGSLTGYAGGLVAKRWLLDHEARIAVRA